MYIVKMEKTFQKKVKILSGYFFGYYQMDAANNFDKTTRLLYNKEISCYAVASMTQASDICRFVEYKQRFGQNDFFFKCDFNVS